MENLYKGPGVVDTYTVDEGYESKKFIPFEKIRVLINKMHKAGVIHADMHQNNIMIQKIKGPFGYKYRPLIIDFGRSLKTNKSFKTNANANAYVKIGRTKDKLWWYSNDNGMPVLLNGNAWNMAKQMNRRAPKGPGIMTRLAQKFTKKINYIDKLKTLTNTNFIKYYWNARSTNNQTKPGLIKNIIMEIAMIKSLLANSGSGITGSYVAPFFKKISNYSGNPVSNSNSDYYRIHKILNKLTVRQLQDIKASVPDLD
jgi:hypothetical protein